MKQLQLDAYPRRWAKLSPCKHYRYVLGHRWAPGPMAVFGLCNPSKADAEERDQTDRVTDGFARNWGCGGKLIVNPCAYRATDSDELLKCFDPIGPDNAKWLARVFGGAERMRYPFVVGWGGALPERYRALAEAMVEASRIIGLKPLCLGTTKDGQPRHPLMLSYSTLLKPYEVAA